MKLARILYLTKTHSKILKYNNYQADQQQVISLQIGLVHPSPTHCSPAEKTHLCYRTVLAEYPVQPDMFQSVRIRDIHIIY